MRRFPDTPFSSSGFRSAAARKRGRERLPGPPVRRAPHGLGALFLGILFAVVASGCSDELLTTVQQDVQEATAPKDPAIAVVRGVSSINDGDTLDFGSQPVNSHTTIALSIKNTGTGTLLLETPSVEPSDAADGFSVESLSGTSVAPGASVNFVLDFAPAEGTGYTARVTIPSNATNDDSVAFDVLGTGIAPDTEAPTGSLSIAGGAAYTQSADVTLTLSAADAGGGTVTEMEVGNTLSFTGNWQAYATSLPWTLSSGDGTKSVYARYRDNSGNISSATISDTIILDTVAPTVSSRTPAAGALYQSRTVNAVVNFSEDMDQSTMTSSSVYLKIKGGATVTTAMSKTATSVTLDPTYGLAFGYDYQIVVSSAVKDLSGRSISNSGSTDFTVDRDIWEGGNGNDLPADAYDLSENNYYGIYTWTDFVPDTQQETDSWTLPTGAHSPLAVLEGIDYYTIEVPPDAADFLNIEVLFTTDTDHGTTVDSSGSESLRVYVNHNGHSMDGYRTATVDQPSHRLYEYTISDPDTGGAGTYTIMIYENSDNYANRRTYNLRWESEPGI